MTTPTTDWPKPYILQVHAAAVEHGLVFIEKISAANADSFKQRFYRARRRSDKAMAAFIPPEYHLVMIGEYQPLPDDDPAAPGRLPIIYNQLPDGSALPPIRAADANEAMQLSVPALANPAPQLAPASDILDALDPADLKMDEGEIDVFVDKMLHKVSKK